MSPSAIQTPDAVNAAYRRQMFLHTLPPSSREVLEQGNRRYMALAPQPEPAGYQNFVQRHRSRISGYQQLQPFYDQLAFAATVAVRPGFVQRFFTFRDAQTYSACLRPRLLLGRFNDAESRRIIQALESALDFTIDGGCKALSGWIISTADAEMLAALDAYDCPGSRSRCKNGAYYQASYWGVDADHFVRLRDLILHFQGDYVLPFRNDPEIAPIHLKQLAGDELQTLTGRQDAWI